VGAGKTSLIQQALFSENSIITCMCPEPVYAPQSSQPKFLKTTTVTLKDSKVPFILFTFDRAKVEVDHDKGARPDCPDSVIREIIRSSNPREKIAEVRNALKLIAKYSGDEAQSAFKMLEDEKIAKLFVGNPQGFAEISKATGEKAWWAFKALGNKNNSKLFSENPETAIHAFSGIVNAAGKKAWCAFLVLENDMVSELFIAHIDEFIDLAKAMGAGTSTSFLALTEENTKAKFLSYCNGETSMEQLIMHMLATDSTAIEIGMYLDVYHSHETERKKYLDSLSTAQVFGLLCSNPELFYTSTSHMLFDRLIRDIKEKPITELFEEYGLVGTEQCRNFMFRAINYGRFYGGKRALLKERDVMALLPTLLEPLKTDKFEKKFFFHLANAIDEIQGMPEVIDRIKPIVKKRLKEGISDKELKAAFEFICCQIDKSTGLVPEEKKAAIGELDEKRQFDSSIYASKGKIVVLQVFDREDTQKDHWGATREWFTKYYGKEPSRGPKGELVFENSNSRMILFMGRTEQANQEFIKKQLHSTPDMVLTFRGHSFSLKKNFPYDIFENTKGHILFIPGSCGSAGSTPEYICANPNTDLRCISNVSEGRGQVTNALVEALLGSGKKPFEKVLADSTSAIAREGGSVSTLRVWSRGEELMRYVLDETKE
jgi:hypothetical protein